MIGMVTNFMSAFAQVDAKLIGWQIKHVEGIVLGSVHRREPQVNNT